MINTIEKYSDIQDIINKDLVMIIAKSHTCNSCNTISIYSSSNKIILPFMMWMLCFVINSLRLKVGSVMSF